jgi:chitinase
MNRTLSLLLILLPGFSNFAVAQTRTAKETPYVPFLIVGYLSEDNFDHYTVREIETRGAASMLSHIIYAFANVANGRPVIADQKAAYKRAYSARESLDGIADDRAEKKALRGAFNQLRKLKARHPRIKLLISIGGANQANSKGFSLASRTERSRQQFVTNCLDLFIRGNLPQGISATGLFDGIDVDWEFPTDCSAGMKGRSGCIPQDKVNFTLLLTEFRRQLDEQGQRDGAHYQLTMASSAWVDDYPKYELRKIHPLLDFINLMTYGLAPPGKTRPHSPLYKSSTETGRRAPTFNTDYAVKHYLEGGVPANKIVMGVPFYGLGWDGVPDINNGLYQKTASAEHEADYAKLKNLTGFHLFRDPETRALWLYSPTARVFWSFDDPASLSTKMAYVIKMRLGGVMLWEISGDDRNSSLLKAICDGLRQ